MRLAMKAIALLLSFVLAVPAFADDADIAFIIATIADIENKPAEAYRIASISGGSAEPAATEAPPVISETSRPADQQPTPMPVIAAAINALKPQVGDVFIDFGCGPDARGCIVAARDCGLDAIGVEIDPAVAEEARRVVAANGLSHKIRIITGDATQVDVPEATIGFAYLWSDTLAALRPKIERLRAFASYAHDVPGLPMDALEAGGDTVYVWRQRRFATIPAQYRTETYQQKVCGPGGCRYVTRTRQVLVSPARTVEVGASSPVAQPAAYVPPPAVFVPQPVSYQPRVGYWNGRAYTAPKRGCYCAMCRSLRRQLGMM
jgi:hypothetical protein